jgi:CubicO group peptidase (beta-lactamase class C family)
MQTRDVEAAPERRQPRRLLRVGRRGWTSLAVFAAVALLIALTVFLKGRPLGLRHGIWVSQGETEQLALEFKRTRGLATGRTGELRGGRMILEWGFAGTCDRPDQLELRWGREVVLRGTLDLHGGTIEADVSLPDGTTRSATFVRTEPGNVPGFNALADPTPYRLRAPASESGWDVAPPDAVGIDPARLEKAVRAVARGEAGLLHSMILTRHGKLVLEEYFHGYGRHDLHQIQSCTKSVASLLVGIAIDRGEIAGVDVPVFEYFPEHADLRTSEWDAVTLRHLLTMSAGLDWSPREVFSFRGTGPTFFRRVLLRRVVYEPGTRFLYIGADVNLLAGVLRNATGQHADDFAGNHLFEPLGVQDWDWERAKVEGYPSMAGTLQLRPLDMAKLGQLVLNQGRWNGKQIVSSAWIREATAGAMVIGQGKSRDEYGYLWWHVPLSGDDEPLTLIVASGWGSQFIHISPELDAVLVTTGGNNFNGRTFDLGAVLREYLQPAFEP